MRYAAWIVVGISVLVAGAVEAWADPILFDNGSAITDDTNQRFNYAGWTVYDDFVLTRDSTIRGFEWSQFDEESVVYSSTTLYLLRAAPTHGTPTPPTLLALFNLTATRTSNGLTLGTEHLPSEVTSDELLGFDYAMTGFSLDLDAGTYYVGFYNLVSGGATLMATSEGTTNAIDGFWQNTPGELGTFDGYTAFRVIGTPPVPEPASLALFGLGAVGLVAWRRRRW